jgi:glucose-1-phosphate cytidylyltransferase
MKVILLAGGFGTRMSEYTVDIPKPMVPIGGKPILFHIMNYYSEFGHKDFFLALGYKSEVIKKYFLDFNMLNSDFRIDYSNNSIEEINKGSLDWKINLIDTGLNTMTGGRLKRLKDFVKKEPFMLTYGDGLSNVDLNKLIDFHKSHGKIATMSAVRPVAKFGELIVNEQGKVESFKEKPQLEQGWINGGFFIFEPEIFDYIEGDEIMLEREPLESLVRINQLMSYRHNGFWKCMDTKRDHEQFERMFSEGNTPWIRKY